MNKETIVVKKVNLQQEQVDKLNQIIEMKEENIKYQVNKYCQLLHKLDSKEPFGLNCLLFTYDELVNILKNKHHQLHDYIYRWFVPLEDCDFKDNKTLYFSEDGIEVKEGDYWLVNIKTDYAVSFDDIEMLNRKVYGLESDKE